MLKILITCILMATSSYVSIAQGPRIGYYFNSSTTLSWSDARISFKSGSKQNVSYIPAVNSNYCPYGTGDYSDDVTICGKLVFLSDYKNRNAISNELLAGKVILMPYSGEERMKNGDGLLVQIRKLCQQNISAVILFSEKREIDALVLQDEELTRLNIPIVFVDSITARNIFEASGTNFPQTRNTDGDDFEIKELICSFQLNLKGNFELIESEYCTIRFNSGLVDSLSAGKLANLNDSAQAFLLQLFEPIYPVLPHQTITIFSDYDEKIFYTFHWGKGLATENGNFSVVGETVPAFQLSVHEMTHTLFYNFWGKSCSFFNEGIAMFAEAKAGTPDVNHQKTLDYLLNRELLPLQKLLELDIGGDRHFTEMGYAAAGSFTGFFIETYGMNKLPDLWKSYNNREGTFYENLNELETDWHNWLLCHFSEQ